MRRGILRAFRALEGALRDARLGSTIAPLDHFDRRRSGLLAWSPGRHPGPRWTSWREMTHFRGVSGLWERRSWRPPASVGATRRAARPRARGPAPRRAAVGPRGRTRAPCIPA